MVAVFLYNMSSY